MGIAFSTEAPQAVVMDHGPPILPVEDPHRDTFHNVRHLCNDLHTRLLAHDRRMIGLPVEVTLSASGRTDETLAKLIGEAIESTSIGRAASHHSVWLTRGEACYNAYVVSTAVCVVKPGNIAFVHAFPKNWRRGMYAPRVGGWGSFSGDDGGGYSIGRHLLYRAFAETDRREQQSGLIEMLRQTFDRRDIFDITRWIRDQGPASRIRHEVSRLASIVTYAADNNQDPTARAILRKAVRDVRCLFRAALLSSRAKSARFGHDGLAFYLHGGLIRFSPFYTRALCAMLRDEAARAECSPARFVLLDHTPLYGALQATLRRLRLGRRSALIASTVQAHVGDLLYRPFDQPIRDIVSTIGP